MTPAAEIISFGYGHAAPPPAHVVVDVRGHFRDPHIDPALRDPTGEDREVARVVLATPGVRPLACAIALAAVAFGAAPRPGPVTVAIGCAGGRHRAPVIAAEVAALLARIRIPVTLTHRDIGRPVIACGGEA